MRGGRGADRCARPARGAARPRLPADPTASGGAEPAGDAGDGRRTCAQRRPFDRRVVGGEAACRPGQRAAGARRQAAPGASGGRDPRAARLPPRRRGRGRPRGLRAAPGGQAVHRGAGAVAWRPVPGHDRAGLGPDREHQAAGAARARVGGAAGAASGRRWPPAGHRRGAGVACRASIAGAAPRPADARAAPQRSHRGGAGDLPGRLPRARRGLRSPAVGRAPAAAGPDPGRRPRARAAGSRAGDQRQHRSRPAPADRTPGRVASAPRGARGTPRRHGHRSGRCGQDHRRAGARTRTDQRPP